MLMFSDGSGRRSAPTGSAPTGSAPTLSGLTWRGRLLLELSPRADLAKLLHYSGIAAGQARAVWRGLHLRLIQIPKWEGR